jgi:hypothetical protein
MSVRVDEYVLFFYSSMYDVVTMNVLDSKKLHKELKEAELSRQRAYEFCHIESHCSQVK